MNRSLLLPFASALVLLSCTDDSVSPLPAEPDAAAPCPLSGSVLRIGSDDGFATPEERPGWTRFRHDVRMDRTEMTQAEYASLLWRNPSTFRGDSLPVTDVSWYDAVLAANARSRRDGLDTVYEYTAISSDAQGNASGLDGLTIHLDRSGWRLPTEAEWEAAARAGTSTAWAWGSVSDSGKAEANAWYQKSAGGRTHPVGTKSPNAWGLHDMAGNVMEWVNDWKGAFPKDTVEGFAGQESPGDVAEVPLKGGSYNYGISQLRPSSRAATYAAYRSSRAEYVGFRLCRGGFAARYSNSSGVVVQVPQVTLTRTDLARSMGVWEARLVFVNRANGKGVLTWIDYGEANPVARSLPDKDPVFHPSISPDGRWVAWSTALEGSTGASRIKARRLAKNDTTVLDLGAGAIPRWWVSGTDTFLIVGDARDNLASGWSAAKTMAWHWSNGVLSNPATWSSEGSYHDGRSGSYLYTGYRRLRQHDVRSGASRILFTAPLNGKSDGDTSQVCNVSAAPDSSGRVMFLDFGYTGTSGVVKRSYGIHEIAFVSDSTGRVLKTIPRPADEAQWEHMEWSNSPKWAASGAIDRTGAYRNLYLVDVETGASTRVVSGEQLWQPTLWTGEIVNTPTSWVDSLGRYDLPEVANVPGYQKEVATKLVMARLNLDQVEIAALGSSRTFLGIDPLSFRSGKAWNLSAETGVLALSDTLLRRYLLPGAANLKAVVMDLHMGWLMTRTCDGICDGLVKSRGYAFDRNHEGDIDAGSRAYATVLASRTWPVSSVFDKRGGGGFADRSWGSGSPTLMFPQIIGANAPDTSNEIWKSNLGALQRLATDLERRGIVLVLVEFPQSPNYRNTEYAGIMEPKWSRYEEMLKQVRTVMSGHANTIVYDAYRSGRNDYVSSEFWDENHLATSGAKKLSQRVDSILTAYWASKR